MRSMDIRMGGSWKRTWNGPPNLPPPHCRNWCRLALGSINLGKNGMPSAEGKKSHDRLLGHHKACPRRNAFQVIRQHNLFPGYRETHRSLSLAKRQGSEAPAASSVCAWELPFQICWESPLLFVLINSIFIRLTPSPVCMIFFPLSIVTFCSNNHCFHQTLNRHTNKV